jgi:hypothetical protein
MPARAVRPTSDRDADRTKVVNLATDLRADVASLQAAIATLPAPGVRNAAQTRDALVMRTLIRLVRFCLISSGAGTAADRGNEPA